MTTLGLIETSPVDVHVPKESAMAKKPARGFGKSQEARKWGKLSVKLGYLVVKFLELLN